MTREEAAKILKEHRERKFKHTFYTLNEYQAATDMAIKALEQQPCDDVISRQAVLDINFKRIIFATTKPVEMIEQKVKALPSVAPQQKIGRWIPVSEKLPEVNQKVLVTSYGRVCYAMMTSVDGNSGYPIFRLQDSLNGRVICETTVHSEFTTSRITAWMPLPPSYKGESEDKA